MKKSAQATVHRIPLTRARINLGQLAKRAHLGGEYFILERDGIPVIGIVDADELEDHLEQRDPRVRAFLAKSCKESQAGKSHPAEELLVKLKALSGRKSDTRWRVPA